MQLLHSLDIFAVAPTISDTSFSEFRLQLEANGFVYVPQTRGFLDLRRDRRRRFKRLLGVRDNHGRLMRRETIAFLLASRMP
jgi:hypothetical protein